MNSIELDLNTCRFEAAPDAVVTEHPLWRDITIKRPFIREKIYRRYHGPHSHPISFVRVRLDGVEALVTMMTYSEAQSSMTFSVTPLR